ncbi:hypothetical protein EDEG_03255 [Edhazardia aedis USNM 41457]|uniref:Uncharacterized protein n=1 Tax=Edhazardia aedis (strain USNM 41457) TaxID=1003232 RepID=J9DI51_EDHAE|nr:hypothetical protein EDEG_03255 [Edhazardia aedis USNM 41457]|eukprot:EJW02305.1 hypothetical protein EDEG_03255 [Edhazardia aedis USNM 41457]
MKKNSYKNQIYTEKLSESDNANKVEDNLYYESRFNDSKLIDDFAISNAFYHFAMIYNKFMQLMKTTFTITLLYLLLDFENIFIDKIEMTIFQAAYEIAKIFFVTMNLVAIVYFLIRHNRKKIKKKPKRNHLYKTISNNQENCKKDLYNNPNESEMAHSGILMSSKNNSSVIRIDSTNNMKNKNEAESKNSVSEDNNYVQENENIKIKKINMI